MSAEPNEPIKMIVNDGKTRCPNCGTPYDLNDYRDDVLEIFCSACKTKLNGDRRTVSGLPQKELAPKRTATVKSKTHAWTVFFFLMSVSFFAYNASLDASEIAKGSIGEETKRICLLFGILFVVSTIPLLTILFGKRTPRNWNRLLGWIIVESIYNPVFGIPIWIAWVKERNKARYGDEVAFRQEAIEAQIRGEAIDKRIRKILTKAVAANAVTTAYKNMSPEKREQVMQAGIDLTILAALNPDKTKQVKKALSNLGNFGSSGAPTKASAAERMQELKHLYENKLISRHEYEAKRSEILSQL